MKDKLFKKYQEVRLMIEKIIDDMEEDGKDENRQCKRRILRLQCKRKILGMLQEDLADYIYE